jgi:hypothetical protein
MRRRSFRPTLGASGLEARISLSRAGVHAGGIPVLAYGSETNPGMFNGIVEKKDHGHWYDAVFFIGQRRTDWALHPGEPTSPGAIYLLQGDTTLTSLPRGHSAPKLNNLPTGRRG